MNYTKEKFFSPEFKEEYKKRLDEYENKRKYKLEKRKDRALSIANEVAKMLKKDYHATSVILFGSLAYGNFGEYSDIDLYVIGFQGNYWQAVSRAIEISQDIDISIMCEEDAYEEFKKEARERGIKLC